MKYIREFLENFKKTPAFTFKGAERFLKYKGSTSAYAKLFMSKLVKSGRTYRITKGNYSLFKDNEIVGFPFYPFYYGLGFALTNHGLSKQQFNPHVITTRNVRAGLRTAFCSNFYVSKISEGMFFGYIYVKGENFSYPLSDIEKTLIDMLYYDFSVEEYVYENIFKRLDKRKTREYLKLCNDKITGKYTRLERLYGKFIPS